MVKIIKERDFRALPIELPPFQEDRTRTDNLVISIEVTLFSLSPIILQGINRNGVFTKRSNRFLATRKDIDRDNLSKCNPCGPYALPVELHQLSLMIGIEPTTRSNSLIATVNYFLSKNFIIMYRIKLDSVENP